MPTRDSSGSLMVMMTYACPLRCVYCGVLNGPRSMEWETLRSAVELLLTAPRRHLLLRYFGGEPLLRWKLIRRAISYAERRQAGSGKSVRHMITTNGLLLDGKTLSWLRGHDVEIMLSLDGSAATHRRRRPAASGRDVHGRLRANLRALQDSGVPYFVNAVVDPGDIEGAREDLALLAGWGVRRLQIGYRVGVAWSRRQKSDFLRLMEEALRRRAPRDMEILNRGNQCEPVMLSDEILVDTDGMIYLDAAVFLEREFPRLRETMRLGALARPFGLAGLRRSKSEVLRAFRAGYPPGTSGGELFANNLALGVETGRLVADLGGKR